MSAAATAGAPGGTTPFGARLQAAMRERSPLCVGIDPHTAVLAEWSLAANREGLETFGRRIVDAATGRAAAVKPQVAFFERAGADGFLALAATIDYAQAAGLLVIADAKRGDIGTTAAAYADAWINPAGAFHADAMTLSPYLGYGALSGSISAAKEWGSGVFVLAATSNPEGRALQTAHPDAGGTVAAGIVSEVAAQNRNDGVADGGLGSVGLVLGATLDLHQYGLDANRLGPSPVLAPGFGAQGARIEDLRALYGDSAGQVLVSESRGLTAAGPGGIASAIAERVERIAAALA